MNDNSFIVCKKNTLQNIARHNNVDFDSVLVDAIERTNKIVSLTYLFIKLYFLHLLENDNKMPYKSNEFPIINTQFVRDIMNTITIKKENRGRKGNNSDSLTNIENFYNEHFKLLLSNNDIINRDNLKAVLNYEEKDIIKNIKTNIAEHFMSHLRFFIKIRYKFDNKFDKIKNNKNLSKNEKIDKCSKIHTKWDNIVSDIINVKDDIYLSKKKYHKDIDLYKLMFIPFKNCYDKGSIPYDVKSNTFDYLFQMININKELEKINDKIIEKHTDQETKPKIYKLFNPLPLRTSIVPKYITLDTVCLIDLFITKNSKTYRDKPSQYKDEIWKKLFRTYCKTFKRKGYTFNHMIKTDGIACSVILIKVDENGSPIKVPLNYENNDNKESKMEYIDDVKITKRMKSKEFIVCDPGKNDIGNYMKEDEDGSLIYYKYTQRQRNHHTKKRKYILIKEKLSDKKINGKTVKEIESELINHNSKTCNYNQFKNYIQIKIKVNRILYDHYKQIIYRKLKWNTFINKNRNEDIMLNKFKEKMGSPEDNIIIFGNWSDNGMKGKEPSISKRNRRLFINRGYECYLIDEHNTSRICSHCHKGTMNLKIAEKAIWKLLRCTSCKTIHNRDHNATKNMLFIVKEYINQRERPKIFKKINKN